MAFVFQQPGTAKLLEAIDLAAASSDAGGGVFAFASKGGIDSLFRLANIDAMLTCEKPLHLIVGIDAITNADALLCLVDKLAQCPSLTAEAFFHECPNSTFHPKFSWFVEGSEVRLVTGSGNLTLRGLGKIAADVPPAGNWEAFAVQILAGVEATAVKQLIDEWLAAQRAAGTLCSLVDERVRNKAMANGRVRFSSGVRRPRIAAGAPLMAAPTNVTTPVDGVDLGLEILVRELPATRRGQADVGRLALTDFFGYAGVAIDVLIQHVSDANLLEPADQIRLFVNASSNYRLELRAINGVPNVIAPDDSRMILIAAKLDHRSFRYTILPTTAPDYLRVATLLGPIAPGRRLMRERRVTREELLSAWPNVPDNLLPIDALTPEP